MSKHPTDPKFSPLLWLVPMPFVLATCLPLDLDHSRAARPTHERVAAAAASPEAVERAASAPGAKDQPLDR